MTDRKLTVVLPVYNGVRHIVSALDSVISQSYESFDFIICDDGSTDGSFELLSKYKKLDNRIVLLRNRSNLGLFQTLNKLIRGSQTQWIRLFAQDDRLKPGCLEKEVAFAEAHSHVGMFYCSRDIIDDDGNILKVAPPDSTPEIITPWLADQISYYCGSMPGNIANVTLNRTALDEIGLFDESLKVSGDFEMWVKISSKYSIGFINESLMEIRDHPNQFSRKKDSILFFIREDRLIYNTLRRRLPKELQKSSNQYDEFNRGTQYLNAALRLFASADFPLARMLFKEIKKEWSVGKLFLFWLVSANRRFFKPNRCYVEPAKPVKIEARP